LRRGGEAQLTVGRKMMMMVFGEFSLMDYR